jgi:hypothetical protein
VTANQEAPPPVQPTASVAERLATLEERTAPKLKTWLDKLKDWGGVASLVIAIGYSFPLGLWEKFYLPGKQREAAEVQKLRDVIEQTTTILSEGARSIASIQDPFLKDTAARAINTRIFLLLSKHRVDFETYGKQLTAPELLVVGHNFAMTNQAEAALPYFEAALATAGPDVQSKFEAMRQIAKSRFAPGAQQNRIAARKGFASAVDLASGIGTMKFHAASLNAEWALFELIDGDWSCGQAKLSQARLQLAELAPFMNDNGNFARLIEDRTARLMQQPWQSANGCG